MKPHRQVIFMLVVVPLILGAVAPASVDDAQSFALQAAEPYVREGFQVREDYWGGDLAAGEKKAVRQQLFKGNEYWFWMGTEVRHARISVHIYDKEGKLIEQPDSWQKGAFASYQVVRLIFLPCRKYAPKSLRGALLCPSKTNIRCL